MKRILFTLISLGSITFAADQKITLSNLLNNDNALTSSGPSVTPLNINTATSSSSSQASTTTSGTVLASSHPNDISSDEALYNLCVNKYPHFALFTDYGIGEMQSTLDAFRTLNSLEMSLVGGFFVRRSTGFKIARQLSENEMVKTSFNYMLPHYRRLYGSRKFWEPWCKVVEQCKLEIATSEEDCASVDQACELVQLCSPSSLVINDVVETFYHLSLGHLSNEDKVRHCQQAEDRARAFWEAAHPIVAREWNFAPARPPQKSRSAQPSAPAQKKRRTEKDLVVEDSE